MKNTYAVQAENELKIYKSLLGNASSIEEIKQSCEKAGSIFFCIMMANISPTIDILNSTEEKNEKEQLDIIRQYFNYLFNELFSETTLKSLTEKTNNKIELDYGKNERISNDTTH